MTPHPVVRSSSHVQWGGGERGQVATQTGDEGGREKKRCIERLVFRVKNKASGNSWGIK